VSAVARWLERWHRRRTTRWNATHHSAAVTTKEEATMSEIEDLRAEVARLRVACTEFEDAYVGEHEDRVAAGAKLRAVEALADRWDGYGHGRFNIHPAKSLPCTVCDLLAGVRAALAVVPAEVTCTGNPDGGCCTACQGTGYSLSDQGMCWDCRGTGHPHEQPAEVTPPAEPDGLVVSDDRNLLNWRGVNYVRQAECDSCGPQGFIVRYSPDHGAYFCDGCYERENGPVEVTPSGEQTIEDYVRATAKDHGLVRLGEVAGNRADRDVRAWAEVDDPRD
jgi:hypothetical protein